MSVTFHIYRPIDVTYNGYYMDTHPFKELDTFVDGSYGWEVIEKKLGAPDDTEEFQEWEKEQKAKAWSDGIAHDMIDITYFKVIFGNKRSWRRYEKKLNKFDCKTFITGDKNKIKYIPVDEVAYSQGWCLKNKFFNKECTISICTSKEQMFNFFKQYLNFSKDFEHAKSMLNTFIQNYQEGDIFVAAW